MRYFSVLDLRWTAARNANLSVILQVTVYLSYWENFYSANDKLCSQSSIYWFIDRYSSIHSLMYLWWIRLTLSNE